MSTRRSKVNFFFSQGQYGLPPRQDESNDKLHESDGNNDVEDMGQAVQVANFAEQRSNDAADADREAEGNTRSKSDAVRKILLAEGDHRAVAQAYADTKRKQHQNGQKHISAQRESGGRAKQDRRRNLQAFIVPERICQLAAGQRSDGGDAIKNTEKYAAGRFLQSEDIGIVKDQESAHGSENNGARGNKNA